MAKFEMGQLVATPSALKAIEEAGTSFFEYIRRHLNGDWGDICKEDAKENEFSLKNDLRLMSIYTLSNGVKIWIITEADRSTTTILLPEDY